MKTIRVYGDSYCAPWGNVKCWPEILGDNMNLPVVNKGISGSSTEYATKCFANDVAENVIEATDIVIFVTSTPGRLAFSHQNYQRPETASLYVHAPSKLTESSYGNWYKLNKHHIEWTQVEQDLKLLQLNHESYLRLIKDVARSMPDVTFLILPNSDHYCHILESEGPKNFLKSSTYLNIISGNEFKDNLTYHDWVRPTGIDYRVNHFTVQNLKILAKLVEQSINELTVENITYDKFQKDVLRPLESKEQYLEYVSNGYLYDMLNVDWFTKKVPPLK